VPSIGQDLVDRRARCMWSAVAPVLYVGAYTGSACFIGTDELRVRDLDPGAASGEVATIEAILVLAIGRVNERGDAPGLAKHCGRCAPAAVDIAPMPVLRDAWERGST
jgi:hypothetical protein